MRYYDRHEDASTINRFIEDLREKCWKPHWEQYCRWGRGLYSVFILACLQTGYIYIYMFDFYWATVGQTTLEIENEVVTSSNCSNISNLSLYSFLHYQTFANPPPKTFPFLPGAKGTRSVPFCCWLMGRMPTDLLGIMAPLIFRVPKALMVGPCIEYPDVFPRIAWCI